MMLNLIWFHRLLIACGILFCASFAVYELKLHLDAGGSGRLVLAIVFAILAVALSWYLRNLNRFLKLPTDRP
ncbi:MAG: hypothetical protein ACRENP_17920 [Longimicrobiales bacterium]